MKKVAVYTLAILLLYGLFREFTLVKVLLMCAGLAFVYGVSRVPGRYILAMKYPLICLSLLATAAFFFYPPIYTKLPMEPIVMFLSFYGIAFYLISLDVKGKGLSKEAVALSILFFSTCFNLFIMGKPLQILSMAVAIMLFLFIMGRTRLMAIIGGATLCIVVYLLFKKTGITGAGIKMGEVDTCLLLTAAFFLLMFSFTGFLKKPNFMKILAFFGFLYVAVDILLVVGFKVSAGLLYQPIISLAIMAPLMGMMAKAEGERV